MHVTKTEMFCVTIFIRKKNYNGKSVHSQTKVTLKRYCY